MFRHMEQVNSSGGFSTNSQSKPTLRWGSSLAGGGGCGGTEGGSFCGGGFPPDGGGPVGG